MNFIYNMICILIKKKGFEYVNGIWRRSLIGIKKTPTCLFWSLYSECCLMNNNIIKIKKYLNKHIIVHYYYAWSLYFSGKFELCIEELKKVLLIYSNHVESIFLLSDCLFLIKRKNEAFELLNKVLYREKSWIKMASYVENKDDYLKYCLIYDKAIKSKIIKPDNYIILKYMSLAAQRIKSYDLAINIWEKIKKNKIKYKIKNKEFLHKKHSQEALYALQRAFEEKKIQLFLISGTLLGFVRNKNFIAHDTDLDLGIFNYISVETVKKIIYSAGCFLIMPQRSLHCIRIRHANGTPIDIFIHYKEKNDYWHSGVKVSWHNSPFNLKKINFMGINIYIPDNPEKYLEENYGKNWNIPIKNFDSAIDCPNHKIENKEELVIHNLMKSLN